MTREEAIKELSCIADEMPSMECANWIEAISMAIEALSQEPCKDAISRQEVLDALDKSKYSNEFCEEHHIDWSINLGMAHIVVNELKPVTPQPKWIPVSSGILPKGYQRILVTKRMFHWANEPAEYTVGIESFSGNIDFVAWMPLPEPYKAPGRGRRERCGMTREDIDRIASEYFNDKESEHEMDEVFDLAKKALEERKEDMLEKMRAKIINLTDGDIPERIWNVDVLEIIDKYTAERGE